MTIEEYARAIAEEAIRHTTRVLDVDWIYVSDTIDDVIASVPAPDVQALRGQIEGEVWEARKRVEAALSAEIVELRAQIDAARAEEREAWMAEIREQRHDWFVETSNWPDDVASLKLVNEVLDELIRARSGAKGAV